MTKNSLTPCPLRRRPSDARRARSGSWTTDAGAARHRRHARPDRPPLPARHDRRRAGRCSTGKAEGSFVTDGAGKVVGSELMAQGFAKPGLLPAAPLGRRREGLRRARLGRLEPRAHLEEAARPGDRRRRERCGRRTRTRRGRCRSSSSPPPRAASTRTSPRRRRSGRCRAWRRRARRRRRSACARSSTSTPRAATSASSASRA